MKWEGMKSYYRIYNKDLILNSLFPHDFEIWGVGGGIKLLVGRNKICQLRFSVHV